VNEKEHVFNALCLGIGTGILLEPTVSTAALVSVVTVGVPVVLGALLPDVDTAFGTHRQTLHNVWVLGAFLAFPSLLGNLHYVWLGITTHYALDLLGNVKGMAVFHPFGGMYDLPVGVPVTSRWAGVVTVLVTVFELAVVAAVIEFGAAGLLQTPIVAQVQQLVA
jgi:hypothetical protein